MREVTAALVPPAYLLGVTEARLQKDPVATQELLEGVAHGIAGFADADGLHHAGVAQLTHAEISVEELRDRACLREQVGGKRSGLTINLDKAVLITNGLL